MGEKLKQTVGWLKILWFFREWSGCQMQSEILLLILSPRDTVQPIPEQPASLGLRDMLGLPMPWSFRQLRKVPPTQACAIRNKILDINHFNQEALSGLPFKISILWLYFSSKILKNLLFNSTFWKIRVFSLIDTMHFTLKVNGTYPIIQKLHPLVLTLMYVQHLSKFILIIHFQLDWLDANICKNHKHDGFQIHL